MMGTDAATGQHAADSVGGSGDPPDGRRGGVQFHAYLKERGALCDAAGQSCAY